MAMPDGTDLRQPELDVLTVGAGFSGLYLLHRLRQLGFSSKVIEAAADVGGTWYWNRYPGARCDVPTTDYAFSFDAELEREWIWSEKYARQPEILAYLRFVTERYDLRRDITFDTSMVAATWDEAALRWQVRLSDGTSCTARALVMGTGCLSVPKEIDIEGAERFRGQSYLTSRWPHEEVDFTGMRVAVIGTGSSGIQCIPLIAEQAAQLTVFQRTPNFSIPARNGPVPAHTVAALAADRDGYREAARRSRIGVPGQPTDVRAVDASEALRRSRFEAAWEEGTMWGIVNAFADTGIDPVANGIVSEMFREKVRSVVDDPETAEALCPRGFPFGTKRTCLDSGYYETFNLPHVSLVDLRTHRIVTITETGIDTTSTTGGSGSTGIASMTFDAIVYATGFDAMTGALLSVDVVGRDGLALKDAWANGPSTYLGLTTVGFPNFFTITGPGSPSVFSNMAVSIEQHVDWVADCLVHLRQRGFDTVEATPLAEAGWQQHCADLSAITLYKDADSWYMGANVPGKHRGLLPYAGGVGAYRAACEEVVAGDYLGFRFTGTSGSSCNDGVVRRVQPDVAAVLDAMAAMDLPPLESLPVAEARSFMTAAARFRPPGPDVGEIVDGTLPGADGPLGYRLYRPAGPGPHPIVAYFHGGGWVLGGRDSDDPLCRDLCVRAGTVIVSVDYRHAPEHRFPAAVDDAVAAVAWIEAHAAELGGTAGQLAVAGWSAGANLAAVLCQVARRGGPAIAGQLLLTPVTDGSQPWPSADENAEGYVLTKPLMQWFWDHYADPADRLDPRASPLRAEDLSGLPPAVVVTAELDPLRDEGVAYADALDKAGVPTLRLHARGHTHTSLTMVDVVRSGAGIRAEMADALRGFFRAASPGPTPR